ncbi:response regulator [Candidatus Sulfidibacterium hydrothermale]|uniref:response regulator n=1 Tax=Candidatus Sulfidibacterium hydrothermale TaxID=2875962 RepID=UPI001F0B19DE|nr:response regulator [Candidatus Sulfidibacterium hydrothermale]UBM61860.1 response regulator [Candidatus Sulfidibacterium hydrothermale]
MNNKNAHILVVDDSASARSLIQAYLDGTYIKAAFAENAVQAVKKAKSNPFDLIMLDVRLPDISGIEVCKMLKSDARTKDIPVIFVTVASDKKSLVEGFRAGAVDYITKPFEKEELLARVETHLRMKRYLEELVVARKKAEESEKLKMAFLSNMSHEIRTPMNSIVGFAELLQDSDLTPSEREEFSAIIINSGEQLLSIIDEILEVSKEEAGELRLFEQEFSLKKLMGELRTIFANRLKNKPVQIVLRIADEAPDRIVADKVRLKQVLDNLLSNAVKFTEEGLIELGYRLVKKEMPVLEFFVKDTGVGIPKEKQETIFERFTQVEENLTRNFTGTGLGLSIVKRLVTFMGGAVRLRSEPGKGSTFLFTLPYKEPTEIQKDVSGEKTVKTGLFPVGAWEGKTILIADDVKQIFAFFRETLKRTGVEMFYAKDGKEAMEIYTNHRNEIDMALIDVQMPEMNGLEVARAIRKNDPDIPLIAQTGLALNISRKEALDAGFNDVIYKPIKIEELSRIMRHYLG